MSIPIKGFIPASMLDWEGEIATVLFLGGCNFRCPFCQNPELVEEPDKLPNLSWERVEEHLVKRKTWIDGVCISGGEPTIFPGLVELLKKIKSLDLLVKLDTNGSRPKALSPLIGSSLVDCIAMDVKTSFSRYPDLVRAPVSIDDVKACIKLILDSGIRYEFRTTVVPDYAEREDVLGIAEYLASHGAKEYRVQQFNPKVVLSPEAASTPFDEGYLEVLVEDCNQFLPTGFRNV